MEYSGSLTRRKAPIHSLEGNVCEVLESMLPVACALSQGRATNQSLIVMCRIVISTTFAADLRLCCRWFPSDGSPADEHAVVSCCRLESSKVAHRRPYDCQFSTRHGKVSQTVRAPGGGRSEPPATQASGAHRAGSLQGPRFLQQLLRLAFLRVCAPTRAWYIENLRVMLPWMKMSLLPPLFEPPDWDTHLANS